MSENREIVALVNLRLKQWNKCLVNGVKRSEWEKQINTFKNNEKTVTTVQRD